MNYLSKLLSALSVIPFGNIPDSDIAIVLYKGIKEATDLGLIDKDDLTSARINFLSKDRELTLRNQSLVTALEKQAIELQTLSVQATLAKSDDPRNESNQAQPKRRKGKAEAKGQLVDGTFIACVLGA